MGRRIHTKLTDSSIMLFGTRDLNDEALKARALSFVLGSVLRRCAGARHSMAQFEVP